MLEQILGPAHKECPMVRLNEDEGSGQRGLDAESFSVTPG